MRKLTICCLLVILKATVLMVAIYRVQSQGVEPKLCNWDCGYYQDIALKGYGEKSQDGVKAFYPALPVLVNTLWSVLPGKSFAWKATILNLLLFGALLYLLMIWVEGLGFQHSWLVAVLLSFDRFSLWAQVPYTETLFLVLALLFLVAAQRMRDTFLNTMILAILGGATGAVKFVGLSCAGAMGMSRFWRYIKNPPYGILVAVLGSWGVIGFFAYLHIHYGAWTANLDAIADWGRKPSFWAFFKSIFYLVKMGYFPTILLFLGSMFWILKPPAWLKLSVQERWFWLALIVVPLSTTIPTSFTRYLSIIVLGHVFWAFLIRKTRKWPLPWVFDGAWIAVLLIELYFQEQLIEKFLRSEAFSWAG
ncbi:hypothetical protein GW915_09125 [bacterium]|nr:hypothetical protein [bacterium]